MVNNEQLKRDFGFTDADVADIERSSELYASGEWLSGKTRIGYPRTLAGETVSITFRDSIETRDAIDAKASRENKSRSDYLRDLVARDLATA